MSLTNRAVYQRILEEGFNKGNLDVVDELVAPNYINHSDNVRGVEQFKRFIKTFRSAFSNLRIVIIKQSDKGDKVFTLWKATGKQQGELMGISTFGKKIRINANYTSIIVDGQVKEEWCNSFSIGLNNSLSSNSTAM